MKLLLLGATGLVGRTALKQALAKDAISEVVAPTRRPLVPQNKLVNPVNLRLDELAPRVNPGTWTRSFAPWERRRRRQVRRCRAALKDEILSVLVFSHLSFLSTTTACA